MLPCCHTFCEVCLDDLAKEEKVQCPKCQQTSEVPPAGYAINYDLLSSAVESRGAASPSASPPAASEAKSGVNEAKDGKPEIKCAECQEKVATLFCQGSCGDLCDGVEWSADLKAEGIELTLDHRGLKRVARHNCPTNNYRSVLSSRPLAPHSPAPSSSSPSLSPSSSALSGVASFKVRLDCSHGGVLVGVSRALPEVNRFVGLSEGGVVWGCSGLVFNDGQEERSLDKYRVGDVIGVEVDYGSHTVSFFKNGDRQGEPIVLSERDRGQPLYAAVSMHFEDEQVTLL